MGTQAIVSLVDEKKGKTIVKIITGRDGHNAGKVAKWLKKNPNASLQEIYDFARTQFDSPSSLIVMNKTDFIYEDDDELPADYWNTFDNPEWNPRWHYGTADYIRTVKIKKPLQNKEK
jgi:hypothetical protein